LRSIRAAFPAFKDELAVRLVPVREIYSSKVRLRLLLIFAASGLLLLAACTNIANLFLARVAGRATELATRIALGAGPCTHREPSAHGEPSASGPCGAVGAWAAHSGVSVLVAYGPASWEFLSAPSLNLAALCFTLAASVATGVVCGALPALQVCAEDARRGLCKTLPGPRSSRTRRYAPP